jgi:cyclopropane-fatty-acyl-phospholipid synthase
MSMNTDQGARNDDESAPSGLEALIAGLLSRVLRRVRYGRLVVRTPGGARLVFEGEAPGPQAEFELHGWRAARRLLLGGHIGFAESYMDGEWSSPDLTALIELVARNSELETSIGGAAALRWIKRLRHGARANTRSGSRRNIEAHYDLGNEFYALWLDETMTYSSALYATGRESLEQAQALKIARISDLLDARDGQSVLEIGCGWGALACALTRRGAKVTGLTLSPSQLAFARARVEREGLAPQVDLRLEDYRDARGAYDRIVSIEMIEAVGEKYWPVYFSALRDRLRPGGEAVLQVITIAQDRFAEYRRATDFIQHYVFPGGMLPTKEILEAQARAAGLRLVSQETFAESYAVTLLEWRRRFHRAWPSVAALGFDQRFRKLWDYYLSYCEAGFRSGAIDVGLYRFERA